MKYGKWLIPFLLLTIVLASCGATSNNSTSNAANASQAAMSLPEQLLIGTLKLEGTNLAVDKTQAATLLTLWQAYNELLSNNSTAQAETDAVISQIQSSMTSDQLKAITDMKLTYKDITSTMTALGITFTPPTINGTQVAPGQGFGGNFTGAPGEGGGGVVVGNGSPSGSSSGSSGSTGRRSGAGGTSGNPGTGTTGSFPGGGGFNSQNLSPEQIATLQARRGSFTGGSGRIPSALINALIDLLQKRSQP